MDNKTIALLMRLRWELTSARIAAQHQTGPEDVLSALEHAGALLDELEAQL